MPEQAEIEQIISYFEVEINGSLLSPEQMLDVHAITYSDEINTPAMFEFHVSIGHGDTQELKYIDADLFKEGSEVKIKMGYEGGTQEMMTGEITGIEPEFTEEEALTMTIRGYSRLHRLCRGRMTRSFKKMKDSQIAEKIAQENGLTAEVEDTKITHPYIFQNNLSNLDFLLERAQAIGYELSVDKKKLNFRKSAETASPVAELSFGENERTLREFNPRLSTAFQLTNVEARYWDTKSKKEVVSSAKVGDETTSMEGKNSGPSVSDSIFGEAKIIIGNLDMTSQAEAENIAKAKYNQHALNYISGEGLSIGTPEIKAGTVVKLNGLGERFSGSYYISASTHTIEDGIYMTSFSVRRNAS